MEVEEIKKEIKGLERYIEKTNASKFINMIALGITTIGIISVGLVLGMIFHMTLKIFVLSLAISAFASVMPISNLANIKRDIRYAENQIKEYKNEINYLVAQTDKNNKKEVIAKTPENDKKYDFKQNKDENSSKTKEVPIERFTLEDFDNDYEEENKKRR